jgi:glutathione synthase/RimK-type ligase-like ATP-grasp enzyme
MQHFIFLFRLLLKEMTTKFFDRRDMKKIGVLHGTEHSFPDALITRIKCLAKNEIFAEKIKTGALLSNITNDYEVIFDLVSHEVPFYASYLKLAVMNGVKVVNNPFIISPFEQFFNAALCNRIKIKMPKTAILPSKELPPNTAASTLSNLEYPLNWDAIFDHVGFPGIIKPNKFDLSHSEMTVYNKSEFFAAYDMSGNKPAIYQEYIEFEKYFRTFIISTEHTVTLQYDPEMPMHKRYIEPTKTIDENILQKTSRAAIKYANASCLDFIAIDFGYIDDNLYTIDFHTPPEIRHNEIPNGNYNELVEITANFLIELAKKPKPKSKKYSISNFFRGNID